MTSTIIEPIVEPTDDALGNFGLTQTEGGDICVDVSADADILLVNEAESVITMGMFTDLAVDQSVDVFGTMLPETGCFLANEIIVEVAVETP